MPELPEVETIVQDLKAAGLAGRTITSARVTWHRTIAEPSARDFARQIKGLRVEHLSRRGKYAVFTLTDRWTLLIHLRMSGRLFLGHTKRPHDRVILTLDDGREFRFSDTRKFGRCRLTRNPEVVLGKLGWDPLDKNLNSREFRFLLRRHSRLLKPLLLDQTVIAGIGNIYADEALWEAGLHPLRKSDSLTGAEADALLKAIRKVLRRGIRNLGTTLGRGETNFQSPQGQRGRNQEDLKAYGQKGLPCARCGEKIERIIVGQRSTHICPRCQRC